MQNNKCVTGGIAAILFVCLVHASASSADDSLSFSGRLNLHGVQALESDSIEEDPSFSGRVKAEAEKSGWQFHTWLEGGWDGAVQKPNRDRSLVKSFDEVYQDNTPYLEFKELYAARSIGSIDVKAGIQRFAWGRLDEYPPNDLLNPWDFTQFVRRPLEDRKIGVPSLSGSTSREDWTCQAAWVPWFVPYRLSKSNERWSFSAGSAGFAQMPGVEVIEAEPDLPPHTMENSSVAFRAMHAGEFEWALNLFHGYDPRPVFRTTSLTVTPLPDKIVIDPGYEPSFHRITSIGLDGAAVKGDWSFRLETAYAMNRYFNIRPELWGYPATLTPGTFVLNPAEVKSDTLEYGIGADYRPFEDGLVTMQAQQTRILDRPDTLYDKTIETILWASLKIGWMNQLLETSLSAAYNPEHGDTMNSAKIYYTLTDFWKAGVTAVAFSGPSQSIFGRYSINDQVEAEVTYSW